MAQGRSHNDKNDEEAMVIVIKTKMMWWLWFNFFTQGMGDRQVGGLAGWQVSRQFSPEGIPGLCRCHYLSVSTSPSKGLAYKYIHRHVIVWKVKVDQRIV